MEFVAGKKSSSNHDVNRTGESGHDLSTSGNDCLDSISSSRFIERESRQQRTKGSYWEDRYRLGDKGGAGCSGRRKEWRWRVIEKYAPRVEDVIDVGCGELSFWSGRDCERYMGIDISRTALERNRRNRPKWDFIQASASTPLHAKAEVVFCFDVLFHIMDRTEYYSAIENLISYTGRWLFISTWDVNPFTSFRLFGWNALRAITSHVEDRSRIGRFSGISRDFLSSNMEKRVTDGRYQSFRLLENDRHMFESSGLHLRCISGNPSDLWMDKVYVFSKSTPP